MAEPQPSSVHEGMDRDDQPTAPPASAEDRKAAAAMSSLETRAGDEDEAEEKKPNKQIDQEALGKAISRLELADKAGKVAMGDRKTKEEGEKRAKVKVDQADVGLLVEALDLSKGKATELLKENEGDAVRAMRAFVRVAG